MLSSIFLCDVIFDKHGGYNDYINPSNLVNITSREVVIAGVLGELKILLSQFLGGLNSTFISKTQNL